MRKKQIRNFSLSVELVGDAVVIPTTAADTAAVNPMGGLFDQTADTETGE